MSELNHSFINELMVNILEGANIPKVQVERALSPILGMFMDKILTKKFENDPILSGDYCFITPEFPLKKEDNNQSTNIDYLLFNKIKKTIVLLELKTDPSSYNAGQTDTYRLLRQKVVNDSAQFLRTDIDLIIQGTGKKEKYAYVAQRFEQVMEDEDLSNINKYVVIYLVPEAIKHKMNDKDVDCVLTFKDLPQHIEHDYADAWEVISKHLHDLDDMYQVAPESVNVESVILNQVKVYAEKHSHLRPDFVQIGNLESGSQPNYQVTFQCGAVQTFRFNGTEHHIKKFKNINLGEPLAL